MATPASTSTAQSPTEEPPRQWVDAATHHRIIRLSDEPGTASLYFHQNAYTVKGDLLLVTTRHGLSVIDLQTRKIRQVVEGMARNVIVGRKARQVFYLKGDTAYATNLDTGETRSIATEARLRTGSGFAVNADDTLLAGSWVDNPHPPQQNSTQLPRDRGDNYPGKGSMMERRLAAKIPMSLYTIDINSGKINTFNHSTDWLNHVQFSPTDPNLIMFCHEGPWHKVDRIWTIRTDGTGLRKIHTRTMDMEIAGHEFFNPDGKIIWYDVQTPKGKEFWLAGVVLATGEAIRYKVERAEWSVHYNISPDGRFFAGDGGGPNSVAAPANGQWIYLFHPEAGILRAEKLVDLSKHDYKLEPNVTFTPDGKWIVLRSNMFGPTHVFEAELTKAR
ncbi:MAG TPA: oligogalacturonate lyase family protein [Terriglobales bacterium]|nr:oligogalacturonate lyase family protein [Terriglobales bacterium]